MALDKHDLLHLAKLSKLSFSDQELDALNNDLNHIFAMVDIINTTDTSDVAPLSHPHDITAHYRCDQAEAQQHQNTLMQLASASEHDLYLVPNAIEES